MNTLISKNKLYGSLVLIAVLISSCSKEHYAYEVNPIEVSQIDYGSKKQKSPEIFINILYSNLFQKSMGPNNVVVCSNVITSIGDKQVAYDMVISKFMNDPEVKLPTNEDMRKDIPTFVEETYKRFFVRKPSEAEREFFVQYIKAHPQLTPEHVYLAFARSNEYYYY